jgi:hypothetical protein
MTLDHSFHILYSKVLIHCLGLALWFTWSLTENSDCVIGGGPIECKVGETISWDVHSKQGVHFFQNPSKETKSVTLDVTFGVLEGDIQFKIDRNFV